MRKLMTMHKALRPRDDDDRLYVSRKERGRVLTSIEDSVGVSIQRLEDYIQKRGGRLTIAIRNNTDNTKNNWKTITSKQKWKEKQLHGCFKRLISDISLEKTWTWLRKGNWISPDSNTKQRYKTQSYQSNNRWVATKQQI